ncbi:hypothetical protein IL306_008808 [Fusarium sp. DS 682]|nr:hypothetical protein IL306_008808 [Fusarium sp. DS 682]
MNSLDNVMPSSEKIFDQVGEGAEASIIGACASNSQQLIGGAPQQGLSNEECHEKPLPLDQEGIEFEVERLVAKGRIGRRVWYKVKWKGYPASDNSWVKKKDVGVGAIANYEAWHTQSQDEFKFEKLVAKRTENRMTLYEAKWEGQTDSENIWVDKWDIGAKIIARFETDL